MLAAAAPTTAHVSAVELFRGLGWLSATEHDRWRQGRVDCLERAVQADLSKVTKAMRELRRWATAQGLKPSETGYVARHALRGPGPPGVPASR